MVIKYPIDTAPEFAKTAHYGQFRKWSGAAFISHPWRVAGLVELHGGDKEMVAAAWLHDVVEDTDYTIRDIKDRFGMRVAHMVNGLTHISDPLRDEKVLRRERRLIDWGHLMLHDDDTKMIRLADMLANVDEMCDQPIGKFKQKYFGECSELADYIGHVHPVLYSLVKAITNV